MHHHSPSRLYPICDLEYPRKRNRAAAGRRRPRRRRPDAPPTRTNRWRAPARARTAVLGRHAHLLPAARGRLMLRCRCWSGRAGRWRLGRPLHASSRSLERPLVGKSWGDALLGEGKRRVKQRVPPPPALRPNLGEAEGHPLPSAPQIRSNLGLRPSQSGPCRPQIGRRVPSAPTSFGPNLGAAEGPPGRGSAPNRFHPSRRTLAWPPGCIER